LKEIHELKAERCPAFKNRTMFYLQNVRDVACAEEQFTYGSHLCLPIVTKKSIHGIIFVGSPQENAFSEEDLHFLDGLAKTIAMGVQRIL